jgi:putative IMPACT (imprinted ancient) family translation regulator
MVNRPELLAFLFLVSLGLHRGYAIWISRSNSSVAAIKGEGLSDTVCVVVRYFGGIKLGAGGLIRAYGAGARNVLREAPKQIMIPKTTFRVHVSSSNAGAVYDSVAKAGGATEDEEYDAEGNFTVTITCETSVRNEVRERLIDATRGNAIFPDD